MDGVFENVIDPPNSFSYHESLNAVTDTFLNLGDPKDWMSILEQDDGSQSADYVENSILTDPIFGEVQTEYERPRQDFTTWGNDATNLDLLSYNGDSASASFLTPRGAHENYFDSTENNEINNYLGNLPINTDLHNAECPQTSGIAEFPSSFPDPNLGAFATDPIYSSIPSSESNIVNPGNTAQKQAIQPNRASAKGGQGVTFN